MLLSTNKIDETIDDNEIENGKNNTLSSIETACFVKNDKFILY